jgi:hypothetical protein
MATLKTAFAVVVALAFAAQADAGAPAPCPNSGTIVLNGKTVSYKFLCTGGTQAYYQVALPSSSQGTVSATLGISRTGITTTAQACTAIQNKASMFWGALALPLP